MFILSVISFYFLFFCFWLWLIFSRIIYLSGIISFMNLIEIFHFYIFHHLRFHQYYFRINRNKSISRYLSKNKNRCWCYRRWLERTGTYVRTLVMKKLIAQNKQLSNHSLWVSPSTSYSHYFTSLSLLFTSTSLSLSLLLYCLCLSVSPSIVPFPPPPFTHTHTHTSLIFSVSSTLSHAHTISLSLSLSLSLTHPIFLSRFAQNYIMPGLGDYGDRYYGTN